MASVNGETVDGYGIGERERAPESGKKRDEIVPALQVLEGKFESYSSTSPLWTSCLGGCGLGNGLKKISSKPN